MFGGGYPVNLQIVAVVGRGLALGLHSPVPRVRSAWGHPCRLIDPYFVNCRNIAIALIDRDRPILNE
jgi:hypothetical protein